MEGQGHGNRAEAERWLYTANKLLTARDLHGARSFAIRARESDPRFEAPELLLTVIDTLVAGETRIKDHHLDYYAILQVLPYTDNIDYIAAQYYRLATLLDPHRNPFAISAHAFNLLHDAWSLLSNPSKKAFYDNQLRLLTQPPPPPPPPVEEEDNAAADTDGRSFWTACPYCYVMYEYPKVYEDCTLRCQSCRRGFHAVVVRSPPLTGDDESSFCSWGFFPLGYSGNFKDISGSSSKWNPFTPLFPCPLKGGSSNKGSRKGPWVYYDDEEAAAFVEISDTTEEDSDDGDWRGGGNKKGRKRGRRKGSSSNAVFGVRRAQVRKGSSNANVGGNDEVVDGASAPVTESGKKGAALGGSRRRGAGNLGKLDLNVEFSNEVEEPAPGVSQGNENGAGNAEDNIEGIGFFEGLDEFLSSLPILNVVADDKAQTFVGHTRLRQEKSMTQMGHPNLDSALLITIFGLSMLGMLISLDLV